MEDDTDGTEDDREVAARRDAARTDAGRRDAVRTDAEDGTHVGRTDAEDDMETAWALLSGWSYLSNLELSLGLAWVFSPFQGLPMASRTVEKE